MSIVTMPLSVPDVSGVMDYVTFGPEDSAEYWQNKREGGTRIAAYRGDCSPEEFVVLARASKEAHKGFVNEAVIYKHSFSLEDFPDPSDPAQQRAAADLAYETARERWPDALAISTPIHADSKGSEEEQAKGHGGKLHGHVAVINWDTRTQGALRFTRHDDLRRSNDRVMRRHGLSVVTREFEAEHTVDGVTAKFHELDWQQRKQVKEFDKFTLDLGNDIEKSLLDKRSVDQDSFTAVLAEKGIGIKEKTQTIKASADGSIPEHTSVGWTYTRVDPDAKRKAPRRRAASGMSTDFTRDHALALFEHRMNVRREKERQRAAQEAQTQEIQSHELDRQDHTAGDDLADAFDNIDFDDTGAFDGLDRAVRDADGDTRTGDEGERHDGPEVAGRRGEVGPGVRDGRRDRPVDERSHAGDQGAERPAQDAERAAEGTADEDLDRATDRLRQAREDRRRRRERKEYQERVDRLDRRGDRQAGRSGQPGAGRADRPDSRTLDEALRAANSRYSTDVTGRSTGSRGLGGPSLG